MSNLPTDYQSIYQIPKEIVYCSTTEVSSSYNISPCTDLQYGKGYVHIEEYTGFKKLWNPNDTKLKCHKDVACPANADQRIEWSYDVYPVNDWFRIYIPPTTVSGLINVYIHNSNGTCCAISRLGIPPTSLVPDDFSEFADFKNHRDIFPISQYTQDQDFRRFKTLQELYENDWITLLDTGDSLNIVTLNLPYYQKVMAGFWLYTKFIRYDADPSDISYIHVWIWTTQDAYKTWYSGATFDDIGDPPITNPLGDTDYKSIHTISDTLTDGSTVFGFEEKYNLRDTRIVDPIPTIYKSPLLKYLPYNTYFPKFFKVFVPYGCTYLNITAPSNSGYDSIIIARYGSPISKDYTEWVNSLTDTELKSLRSKTTPYTLTDLFNTDCKSANGANTLVPNIVVSSSNPESVDIPNPLASGGWIYFAVYTRSGSHPGICLQYNLNSTRYLTWYDSALWDAETGDPLTYSVTSGLTVDPSTLTFKNVELNSSVSQSFSITNNYEKTVTLNITTVFDEVVFSETGNFIIDSGDSVDITCTYTAKNIGEFINQFSINIVGTSAVVTGQLDCECIAPSQNGLISFDSDLVVFNAIQLGTTSSTTVTATSEYSAPCIIQFENIPTGITVDPTSVTISNTESQEFTITCGYTSNLNIHKTMYVTASSHSEVSIPIETVGVCTNSENELIIVESSLDFGSVTLGESKLLHLSLCSMFTEDLDVVLSCHSRDVKLDKSRVTISTGITTLIEVTYSPLEDNTTLINIEIDVTYLSKSVAVPVIGNCPTYVFPGTPTFLMVNAPTFEQADLYEECHGTFAIMNDRSTSTMATIEYPDRFTGPAGPIEIEAGTPKEVNIIFTPNDSKLFSGNIKVKEVEE